MNSILAEGVEDPTVPTDPNLSAVLEQLQKLAEALAQLQARLDEIDEQIDPSVGEEGYLEARQLSRPRISSMNAGARDVEVMGVRMTAEDSDVTIQRIEVDLFGGQENASWDNGGFDSTKMVRTMIRDLSLWMDGEEIAKMDINRNTVGTGSNIAIRFSGLEIEIEEGRSKDLIVAISAESNVEGEIKAELGSNSIRFVDAANISQTVNGQTSRTFSIVEADDEVVIESTDSIEEGIVVIEENELNEIDMLEFELTAELDIFLETLGVYLEDESGYIDYLTLYDEDGFVDEIDVDGSGDYVFEIDLEFESGETYTFMIVGETWDILREEQGGVIWVDVIEDGTYAIDMDDDDVEGWDIDAEGEELELYIVMPEFSLISRDTTLDLFADDTRGDGVVTFDMEALNGDILLDYILFKNTGNGDFTDLVLTYDDDEYTDYVEIDAIESGIEDGDDASAYDDGDYVLDSEDGSVYEVVSQEFSITDYRTSKLAKVGDYAFDLTDIEKLRDGRDVRISVEGIIQNSGSRERVKVIDIGWKVEDYDGNTFDNYFNFSANDYDFVDILQTPREFIVN